MIVGLGIDITGVDRIEAAIARRGHALLKRLFTPRKSATARGIATALNVLPADLRRKKPR